MKENPPSAKNFEQNFKLGVLLAWKERWSQVHVYIDSWAVANGIARQSKVRRNRFRKLVTRESGEDSKNGH